ncbi:major royal jelly protein 1-like [Schistocerca serialis cubense]|uniref:major royal jelly protein 1-like n=1 Tax=Schistocerca serialis cubense TaxID=2023355 RepID=UPI00214EA5F1|nr:major royal jelly protein 1-like [Schistocerca serialis cubense]
MAVASQRGARPLANAVPLALLVLAVATSACGKQQHQQQRQQQQKEGSSDDWDFYSPVWPGVGGLSDVARWHTLTFDFGGNQTKEQEYRNSGRYDPPSILLIDSEIVGDHVYVTTPLFKTGAPASFSVVSGSRTLDPPLRPFPSWEAHATSAQALTDCSTQMVSVFRSTRVPSDHNTVYLIDSGVVDIASTFQKLCPPKIVTLDVPSATILNTTKIDKEACNSLYIAIEVEVLRGGRRVAYSADVTGFALAVTDLDSGRTHRVYSQYYYPTPGLGVTTIGGVRSYLMDGLFALAVADGNFYSWAFASNTLNKVATRVLRNATDEQILDLTVETLVPGQRAGPAGALAIDASGRRMFFGIAEQEALYCWDTRKPYMQVFFRQLAQNTERLQFFSSVKVLHSDDKLLVVTDRYNKFGQGIVDQQSVNYRVMSLNISHLNC